MAIKGKIYDVSQSRVQNSNFMGASIRKTAQLLRPDPLTLSPITHGCGTHWVVIVETRGSATWIRVEPDLKQKCQKSQLLHHCFSVLSCYAIRILFFSLKPNSARVHQFPVVEALNVLQSLNNGDYSKLVTKALWFYYRYDTILCSLYEHSVRTNTNTVLVEIFKPCYD